MIDLLPLLQAVVKAGASDLHLAVGNPPVARVNGELKIVQKDTAMTDQDMEEILGTLTTPENMAAFHRDKELDFSYTAPGLARFRVNACYQRSSIGLSLRILPAEVPTAKELNLPAVCLDLVSQLKGLVLVTGPTGSGKSTTLAALVNHLNETTSCRVVTMEDPIEYVHRNKRCMIIQREVGADTHSFSASLRRALRQDPDVIMVGELRDVESVALALSAAETGHLVLGTLHTNGAAECIERLVSITPAEQQQQVQFQLSLSMAGIIFQALLPKLEDKGRVAAFEILVGTTAIKNLIRQNQLTQITTYMFMGGEYGMQTLEQSLASLVQGGLVSREEAISRASDRTTLEKLLGPVAGNNREAA